jgi:8-oxo-dGTP diphosphatase
MAHECVAAAIRKGDRLLLCKRSEQRRWFPGVWDLPGGHIQIGETPPQALQRELCEELGIVVDPPTNSADARISSRDLTLAIWLIDTWRGDLHNAEPDEHDAIEWFGLDELPSLVLALPDYLALFAQLVYS